METLTFVSIVLIYLLIGARFARFNQEIYAAKAAGDKFLWNTGFLGKSHPFLENLIFFSLFPVTAALAIVGKQKELLNNQMPKDGSYLWIFPMVWWLKPLWHVLIVMAIMLVILITIATVIIYLLITLFFFSYKFSPTSKPPT